MRATIEPGDRGRVRIAKLQSRPPRNAVSVFAGGQAQNLVGAFGILGPDEELGAVRKGHSGTHASGVVASNDRLDPGGFERRLRQLRLEPVPERSHDDERMVGVVGHGSTP